MPGDRRPHKRSARRPRSSLDSNRVFHAALELVDQHGLEALTIRRLATDLNVDTMAIYRHAANKDALLDALVDITMADLHIDPDAEDWRAQLHSLADQIRAASRAHPNVFPLMLTRPLKTSLSTRPRSILLITEQMLELLRNAGLDPESIIQLLPPLYQLDARPTARRAPRRRRRPRGDRTSSQVRTSPPASCPVPATPGARQHPGEITSRRE